MGHRDTSCDPHLYPSHQATNALLPHAKRPPPGGYVQTALPPTWSTGPKWTVSRLIETWHATMLDSSDARRDSRKTATLAPSPMDIAVGHHFWPQWCSTCSCDKQGRDLVEFRCVLRKILPFDDLVLGGLSTRPALHQCFRRSRKLRTMPHSLRFQSGNRYRVCEDAHVQVSAGSKRFLE